ncbi:hypothetical protein [Pseudacidovorax intermedius]|uniref:hypothetical protein n=1 Tax=Pseudacidovorax intermedius TaxID=433924 RepID=UPI0025DBC69F|nr:hypothetical protein [Pseudacidovorax intermedius]
MHHAPAVSFPVGASRRAAALHGAVAGTGGLCVLGWGFHFAAFDAATVAMILAAVAGVALAWDASRTAGRGVLHWTGGEWSMTDLRGLNPQAGGALAVVMDLGTLMLVRCVMTDGRTHWMWLDRDADPLRWRALRRAAFDAVPAEGRRSQGAPA